MIGIFDSGLGGLTVVKALTDCMSGFDILYFGDTARVPYGSKSPETITEYALQDAGWLRDQGAQQVVIACHSAASVAGQRVKNDFAALPVYDVVQAGLDEALRKTRGSIGIIGTRATINSGVHEKYLQSLAPKLKIFTQACPLFVPLVEEGLTDRPETQSLIAYYLENMAEKIDTLVLACTHYPLLLSQIRRYLPDGVQIVDPAGALAQKICKELVPPTNKNIKLIFSDKSPATDEMVQQIFGKSMPYEVAKHAPLA